MELLNNPNKGRRKCKHVYTVVGIIPWVDCDHTYKGYQDIWIQCIKCSKRTFISCHRHEIERELKRLRRYKV